MTTPFEIGCRVQPVGGGLVKGVLLEFNGDATGALIRWSDGHEIWKALKNLEVVTAFVPTDKQVLWAMNVVGVSNTSAGHTLEDLIPPAEYAQIVRDIITAAQRDVENLYPDTGSLIEAARAQGLRGAMWGDVVFEGKPIADAPAELLEAATRLLPHGAKLMGFGPSAWRGLQVDYVLNGARCSAFQLGVAPATPAFAAVEKFDHDYQPGAYGVCRRCGKEKH